MLRLTENFLGEVDEVKIIARIKQHAVEQPNQSGSAQMLAEELSSLPSLMQKAIEDFSPGLLARMPRNGGRPILNFTHTMRLVLNILQFSWKSARTKLTLTTMN